MLRALLLSGIVAASISISVTAAATDAVPLPPVQPDALSDGEASGEPVDTSTDSEAELGDALPAPRPDDLEGEPSDADVEDLVRADPSDEDMSTCGARIADLGVVFETLDPIDGPGGCGVRAPLKVSEVAGIRLQGPATVNCPTAEALAMLVVDHIVPAAKEHLDATPDVLAIGSSYVCRTRNSRAGAKLSEHAIGNGIDIMSFGFPDRDSVAVAALDAELPEFRFLADVRASACELFTTVLGPGADPAHANHFHLDLRRRKNDYRLCQ